MSAGARLADTFVADFMMVPSHAVRLKQPRTVQHSAKLWQSSAGRALHQRLQPAAMVQPSPTPGLVNKDQRLKTGLDKFGKK